MLQYEDLKHNVQSADIKLIKKLTLNCLDVNSKTTEVHHMSHVMKKERQLYLGRHIP